MSTRAPAPAVAHDRSDLVWTAVVAALGVAIAAVRIPAELRGVAWAEDANTFFLEYQELGPWRSLVEGYAGYQHLVPRILTDIIAGVAPAADFAVAAFWASAVVTGLVGGAVYWLSRDVIQWRPARLSLGLITALLPLAAHEALGNLANLHSYLLWLAPWLLLSRPRSRAGAVGWSLVAFVVAATEIQALLFLPLVLLRLRRADRLTWPLFGAFAAGLVWQLVTVLTGERTVGEGMLSGASLVQGWLINTVLPLAVVNPDLAEGVLRSHGLLLPALLAIALTLVAVAAVVIGSREHRVLVVVLVVASAIIYSAGASFDGSDWFRYDDPAKPIWERMINSRYGVASGLMLIAVVPVFAAALVAHPWRRARRARAALATAWVSTVALIAGLAVAAVPAVSLRADTAAWATSVTEAQAHCLDDPLVETVSVAVAPWGDEDMPCDLLVER